MKNSVWLSDFEVLNLYASKQKESLEFFNHIRMKPFPAPQCSGVKVMDMYLS